MSQDEGHPKRYHPRGNRKATLWERPDAVRWWLEDPHLGPVQARGLCTIVVLALTVSSIEASLPSVDPFPLQLRALDLVGPPTGPLCFVDASRDSRVGSERCT